MAHLKYTDNQILEWITDWACTTTPAASYFNGKEKISWQHLLERKGKNPLIAETYLRAQENRGETVAESIGTVVDDLIKGEITSDVARVAIDAKKWHASKLYPQKYSEKHQTIISGDSENPVQTNNIHRVVFEDNTKD